MTSSDGSPTPAPRGHGAGEPDEAARVGAVLVERPAR